MQFIQPRRSKFKKCTKNYVKDNLLDIIDIEETLLKNRYIEKVSKTDFLYTKFLPTYNLSKSSSQTKSLILKPIPKEKLTSLKEKKPNNDIKNNNNNNDNEQNKSEFDSDNINFEVLNKNKFDINFSKLKLEYKNGYKVLFIKEYFPVEIIGAGGFGLVVHAIQIKTKQKMAVKIINKNNINHTINADYLNNEVNILKILNNPRIMKIYDILDNHHYFFIFMEFIEGGNLKDLIIKRYLDNNKYLFRDSECALIMKGLLEALNYLHKKKIIHRDIKPENILFKNKDDLSSVILCDFGLAYHLNEYEKSVTGSCGTTLYMAPEILLKRKYDFLVDSFSAGIVLYILCSGGMHPFFKTGTSSNDYINKLLTQKCLCNFSTEMPLLARNLFLKLCKFEPIFRYEPYKALNHPWITRSTKSQIPMTILEEYNKSDKIKTFQALLSSVVSLIILKNYFKLKKKVEDNVDNENNSIENLDKNSARTLNNVRQIINIQDKYPSLSSVKRNPRIFLGEINPNGERNKKFYSNKKISLINPNLNLKTTKFLNNRIEPLSLSKQKIFIKTRMSYNQINNIENYNNEQRPTLRTHSSNENVKQKELQKKLKIYNKNKHMKSSEHLLINNIIENKDNNTNNIYVHYSSAKKNGNNNFMNLNNSKFNSIQNNKIFMKRHIVIESKKKNLDGRKNNNNNSNLINNKTNNNTNNIKYNYIFNGINSQLKEKISNFKENNQIGSIFHSSKNKTKNLVLKEIFSNGDF